MKINKFFIVLLILLVILACIHILRSRHMPDVATHSLGATSGKKIVILTSRGGGGQTSVTQALSQQLEDTYRISTTDVFSGLLAPLDLLSTISDGRMTGVDLYNYLVQKKQLWFLNNLFFPIGNWMYSLRHKKIEKLLHSYIKQEDPDLIISVVPIINAPILAVCKELNIPFLLVSPDLDPTMYISAMQKPNYKKFKLLLPFYDDHIAKLVGRSQIPMEDVQITGYPIKNVFLTDKNKALIKQEWGVPTGKPVVFVLLGSQGTTALPRLARELAKLEVPAHCIFGTGKSEHLIEKIEKTKWPANVTTTVVGFTDKVADLMAISDILISKSGSVSFAEALYTDLPMLLDGTAPVVDWEQENLNFLVRHQLGDVITSYRQVAGMVTGYLKDEEKLTQTRERIKQLDKKNGSLEIEKIINAFIK